ncbi:hypothetical protein IWQ60_003702 [Tieghemiomyces parasiticus]|uniref:NADPH--hemoprotein reductase n=1 Tax=Tieghemiomyces parasiticus TaxID=78921 RepID=A0A9W8DW67_9FUNG|nr:hypothetical protein IWQ60_003702 [Tieghemiomyces parasiticus]
MRPTTPQVLSDTDTITADRGSVCPVSQTSSVGGTGKCPFSDGRPTSGPAVLVVVPPGGQASTDGKIIATADVSNLDTFITRVQDAFGLLGSASLTFTNERGLSLDTWDAVRTAFVVHICPDTVRRQVPGPTPYPLVGNIDVFLTDPVQAEYDLLRKYNHLVQITVLGKRVILTSDPDMALLFLKEGEWFGKRVEYPLAELAAVGGNGLFTSNTETEHWRLAHKLLMPAFSASAMRHYIGQMTELTCAALHVFDSFASNGKPVDLLMWTTNIALETIARIGFGYDFDLLNAGQVTKHPFVEAIYFTLNEVFNRMVYTPCYKYLPLPRKYHFDAQMDLITGTVDGIIRERRRHPEDHADKMDLLKFMLHAHEVDDQGQPRYLDDVNIRDQVVTFLIAGHETTSATLTWCLYLLDQHPEVLRRVRAEIDAADLPDAASAVPPTGAQLAKLTYLTQIIRETLRLYPPLFLHLRQARQDTVLPGGYECPAGTSCQVNAFALHRHPDHWGPNPEAFNPDHFLPAAMAARHPGAYLPFSSGVRGCIGMQFAMQEMKIVLAYLLRRFDIRMCPGDLPGTWDKRSSTLRPEQLRATVYLRDQGCMTATTEEGHNGARATGPLPAPLSPALPADYITTQSPQYLAAQLRTRLSDIPEPAAALPAFTLVYGSNMGQSEEYARQLATQLRYLGCPVQSPLPFDTWLEDPATFEPSAGDVSNPRVPVLRSSRSDHHYVLFITSTYNGSAPDNAVKFQAFLKGHDTPEVTAADENHWPRPWHRVRYAVFGCGNSQWLTFQAFPTLVDRVLAGPSLGAVQIFPAGRCDSDTEDTDQVFVEWSTELVSQIFMDLGVTPALLAVANSETTGKDSGSARGLITLKGAGLTTALGLTWDSDDTSAPAPGLVDWTQRGYVPARLTANRELRGQLLSDRSTRHIELRLAGHVPCRAGDHLEVLPQNPPALVASVAEALGLALDRSYTLDCTVPQAGPHWADVSRRALLRAVPVRGTVGQVLTAYADLLAAPPKDLMQVISQALVNGGAAVATTGTSLVTANHHTTKTDSRDLLERYRTTAELLIAVGPRLQNTNGTGAGGLVWADWLLWLPALVPRQYSIASHPIVPVNREDGPTSVTTDLHLTVTVVNDTYQNRRYPGLASDYLARTTVAGPADMVGSPIWVRIQPATATNFHLPEEPSPPAAMVGTTVPPVIMIGAGSGIAPFRGFLQQRAAERLSPPRPRTSRVCLLYFGCQHPAEDFYYQDELRSHYRSGALSRLTVSFSRCAGSTADEVGGGYPNVLATWGDTLTPGDADRRRGVRWSYGAYIQKALHDDAVVLWQLLSEEGAHLYVCGSTGLDTGVWAALLQIVEDQSGGIMDRAAAEAYLAELGTQGRYHRDVWRA